MLKYFLITWIIFFIFIHLLAFRVKDLKKDWFFNLFLLAPVILSLVFLPVVILFDVTYKFGLTGFIISLIVIIITMFFLSLEKKIGDVKASYGVIILYSIANLEDKLLSFIDDYNKKNLE
jgi:hypothetical protein